MRAYSQRLSAGRLRPPHGAALAVQRCLQSTAGTPPTSPPPSSGDSKPAPPRTRPTKGFRLPDDSGISSGLGGFDTYAGSVTGFMKSEAERAAAGFGGGGGGGGGGLPCDRPGSDAALQAAQADQRMAEVAATGKLPSPPRRQPSPLNAPGGGVTVDDLRSPLPSPRRPPPATLNAAKTPAAPKATTSVADDLKAPLPSPRRPQAAATSAQSQQPRRPTPATSAGAQTGAAASPQQITRPSSSSLPRRQQAPLRSVNAPPAAAAPASASASAGGGAPREKTEEVAAYYENLPRNELSKEEMWARIMKAKADRGEGGAAVVGDTEVEYLKMLEDLEREDLFHFRIGELAYPDQQRRRDYYTMWSLAVALNKARWTMLEVQAQRGVKSTGAGMKTLFWKESIATILEKRSAAAGQFTQSHPVLTPFGEVVRRNPKMTKTFVRGFTDARLRVIQQPGNMKQLFDHFDKFYGYFFNSLLEVVDLKDEQAEHMMLHIGRAIGITTHCVMFWKKYARIGFTMLPADVCADNHVNLSLLKNIPLASRDRAVRRVLYDIMCVAKDEMLHAQKLAPHVPPTAWPIVMECLYPNYYLGFLQRRDFNVSAMFADHNIENVGFVWYRLKKRWEWERYQSIERLVDEAAPLPLIGTSFGHRGSKYKMAASSSSSSDGKDHGHSHGGGSGGAHSH